MLTGTDTAWIGWLPRCTTDKIICSPCKRRTQGGLAPTACAHPAGSEKRSGRSTNSHGPCFMQQFIYMHSSHRVSRRFLHAGTGAAAAPGRAACLLLNDGRKRFSGAFAAKETARIRSSWANMSTRRFSSDVKNGNLISTLGEPIDCDTSTANDRKQHSCGDEESSLRAAFTCSLYSRGCY